MSKHKRLCEFSDGDVVEIGGRHCKIVERVDLHALEGGIPGAQPDEILVRISFGNLGPDRVEYGSVLVNEDCGIH